MKRITGKGIRMAGITFAAFIAAGTFLGSGVVFAAEEDNNVAIETMELTNESSPENVNDSDASNTDVVTESITVDEKQMSGTSAVQVNTVENTNLQEKEGTDKAEIPVNEQEEKNGWIYENGVYKFYKDGTAYTGWHYMGKAEGEAISHWSYFDKDGALYTGWHKMGKKEGETTQHWSYFGSNGWLRTGWQKLDKKDGEATPHWSYFGSNGWLRTGWQKLDKKDGEATPHWSYFGSNGWLRTGWQKLDKKDGETTPHWSYFGNNGWLRTGMQTMGTSANPDGNSKQHLSYFGTNGWLVENRLFTYENQQYMADKKGWATAVRSEHEKTLARAMQLVAQVTNESMSMEEKLRACYIHIRDNYPEYNPRIPHYSGEGWHITYANDIFVGQNGRKGGNCLSVAAAFAYMAKAIGFENVYAANSTGHGWAEVNNLVYDAEWERHNSGSYYGVSYNDTEGRPKYKYIFNSDNPYARVRL